MEAEKFSSSGLYWLCKEAENRSSAVDSPVATVPTSEPTAEIVPSQPDNTIQPQSTAEIPPPHPPVVAEQTPVEVKPVEVKRKRGRPARGEGKATTVVATKRAKKQKKEDEDVCFICFDGGSLVLCDRGDCPKAYHPACIKRDEAFFSSNARWTCGWHICSKCQKAAARYMCYTCTYSLCNGCTKDADYLCVRENKGFCPTCFRVVAMIENIDIGNRETVQVDFDDKLTWEYLFKVYWICLKKDLSLTIDEITRAQKPQTAPNKVGRRQKPSAVYYPGNNGTSTRESPSIPNKAVSASVRDNNNSVVPSSWASKELLNFVAYMRNGDTSALSQKEVQALLFDYIKRNNLRDPHQRSEIVCDSKLGNLFGKPRVRHFEMLSLLEFHFLTKDDPLKDEIQGDIIDPVVRQVAGESNSDNLPIISENYKHKVDKKHEERVDLNRSNEVKDACEKLENHVDSSGSTNNGPNNQACLKSESLSGVKSDTSVASLSTGSTPSANDREADNSWHYRDPKGKVQGPFAIEQLHKWSSTEIFPPTMRIWRLNTEERDSVLLTDVIKGQVPLQKNISSSAQEVKGTSDCTSHHCDEPKNGSGNSTGTNADALSNGKLDSANSPGINTDAHPKSKLEIVNGDGPVPHSSNWMPPVVNETEINHDAQIEKSSKCWNTDLPKVINDYANHPQLQSAERSSPFKEQTYETSSLQDKSKVGQTCNSSPNYEHWSSQGNMASQTTGTQCHVNQNNEQCYLGQPSSEAPLRQTSSVSKLNANESHSQYTSKENLSDSPEQKFSINLQDFPMPIPKTGTGVLEAQSVKEQPRWQPPQVCVQSLSTQNVLSFIPDSNPGVLETQTIKDQRWQAPQVSVQSSSMQTSAQNSSIQKVLSLTPESNTGVLDAQTFNEQQRWQPPQVSVQNFNIQNVLSLTPKSIDHNEKDYFRNQKMASLTDNFEKVRATENKHSLSPNFPAQDCGPSWSSVSSLALGGGTHLPKKATKPFIPEWDSSFLSVCSQRPQDVANDHVASPSSKRDELPPPSPPNPVPNASSWLAMMTEPIEFNTLAEESVSDLLAEVDAMESNSDLESPNMLMDYADDLFQDSKTNCFTSLRGLSSPVEQVKNDALSSPVDRVKNEDLSSAGDIMLPPQSNMRQEQIRVPRSDVLDPLKKSKRDSSTSSVMEVETKQFDNTANQFEYRLQKHNQSPPKKIRDLADVMNSATKHVSSISPGSTRRESGQGTPRGSGTKNRGTSDGMSGKEGSNQKHGGDRITSPRERNVSTVLTSPRDRNVPGGDSVFNKGRSSWSRQSSFGNGGSGGGSSSHSRSHPRGQRVCKFYESGYCRKGAFCDYLHP